MITRGSDSLGSVMRRTHKAAWRSALEALFHVSAVGLVVAVTTIASADAPYDESWHMCVSAEQCVWVEGPGGWPDAVHKDHVKSYTGWLTLRAPYTTYFTPGDCFASTQEWDDYVAATKDRVACLAGRCRIDLEWETVLERCTR